MKTSEKYQKAFENFKQSYSYKMGGTQTVILPNGKEKYFDDRNYYEGRGSKYNSSIRHDDLGVIKVSRKEYSAFVKILKEREQLNNERMELKKAKSKRIEEAKIKGIYLIDKKGYVELSDEESISRTFDAERLAKTLKISIKDVNLLNSRGKTYVFAKSDDGNTYQLYHPSLDYNYLTIHIEITTPERLSGFKPEEWQDSPYAHLVGQSSNNNHFVC